MLDKIGFIGIGKMGKRMVNNLLAAGFSCTIYDADSKALGDMKETDAVIATSAGEVGKVSDVVITMLPNSQIVRSVVLGEEGLVHSMSAGKYIIDMSSSYALDTMNLSEELAKHSIILMDAPVSGGTSGAGDGTLTIMVGGTKQDFEVVQPILKAMGKKILLVGSVGHGHALKAINNFLSATSLYATTEAMMMAKSSGLNLEVCLDVINESSGQSYSTHRKFPKHVLPRKFDSGFSLDLLLKDVKMATSMARDFHVPLILGGEVEQVYEAAQRMLGNGKDHTEIVKFLENITDETLAKRSIE